MPDVQTLTKKVLEQDDVRERGIDSVGATLFGPLWPVVALVVKPVAEEVLKVPESEPPEWEKLIDRWEKEDAQNRERRELVEAITCELGETHFQILRQTANIRETATACESLLRQQKTASLQRANFLVERAFELGIMINAEFQGVRPENVASITDLLQEMGVAPEVRKDVQELLADKNSAGAAVNMVTRVLATKYHPAIGFGVLFSLTAGHDPEALNDQLPALLERAESYQLRGSLEEILEKHPFPEKNDEAITSWLTAVKKEFAQLASV